MWDFSEKAFLSECLWVCVCVFYAIQYLGSTSSEKDACQLLVIFCCECRTFCVPEIKSLGLVFQDLRTDSSNVLKCGIAWKEIKILLQLDLERSFLNNPFKQLPARLQTIVWLEMTFNHGSPEGGHQLTCCDQRPSWPQPLRNQGHRPPSP